MTTALRILAVSALLGMTASGQPAFPMLPIPVVTAVTVPVKTPRKASETPTGAPMLVLAPPLTNWFVISFKPNYSNIWNNEYTVLVKSTNLQNWTVEDYGQTNKFIEGETAPQIFWRVYNQTNMP